MDKYKLGTYTNPFFWPVFAGICIGCFVASALKGTIKNMRKVME